MMYKKLVLALLSLFIIFSLPGQPVKAEAFSVRTDDALQSPLCLPGQPEYQQANCEQLGPAAYLSTMKSEGLVLPRTPLPAAPIDPGFGELPYNYVKLTDDETPTFTSLDDAIANQNPYQVIPAGFKYATYVDYSISGDNHRDYMIDQGIWIRGGNTAGRVAPSSFTGLQFYSTPAQQFGWIIYQTESQWSPGIQNADTTVRELNRFYLIQVYQTVDMDGTTWLMIGPNEWVEKSRTALVYPNPTPPEGVTNGRWIEINLYEQTLSVYQGNRMVFATLVSSGITGWWTRPGLFQIYEKLDSTPMSGAFEADRSDYYYLEDVPWTMYFDQARALHGAYWHNYFGYEQSHGCVNLSPADSHWLYLWGTIGDYVYVWDPSGQTPVDESLYTAGGA
ncbi:MAG: L,D-transpeptidase [Anaerolineales bacterium]